MRKEIKLNKILGIKGNEIIILREYFEYNNDHKGFVGCYLVPLTQNEVDERSDVEYIAEFIEGSGLKRRKGQSWGELAEEIIEQTQYDGTYFPFQDDSYVYEIGESELIKWCEENGIKNVVTFECVGGGRIFNKDEEKKFYNKYIKQKLRNTPG
jgi:hypothetical protein